MQFNDLESMKEKYYIMSEQPDVSDLHILSYMKKNSSPELYKEFEQFVIDDRLGKNGNSE